MIFKSKHKNFEGSLKIKLWSKRLYSTEGVKYLGLKIDINWFPFQNEKIWQS